MTEKPNAARQAAQLMARLCSSTADAQTKQELEQLLHRERITLAEFTAELVDVSEEMGAAAYSWSQTEETRRHNWRISKAEDVTRDGGSALDVRLYCSNCGTKAELYAGALPPCTPGQIWQWTGDGWQRTLPTGTGDDR